MLTMLGESPEAKFERFVCQASLAKRWRSSPTAFATALDAQGRVFGEAGVAEALQGKLDRTAAELVAAVQSAFVARVPAKGRDCSILVIKLRLSSAPTDRM